MSGNKTELKNKTVIELKNKTETLHTLKQRNLQHGLSSEDNFHLCL